MFHKLFNRRILVFLIVASLFITCTNCNKKENYGEYFGELFVPDLFDEICMVCANDSIPQAAPYNISNGVHPVLLFGYKQIDAITIESHIHKWSDDLPSEWWPYSIEDLELVVCIGEEWATDVGVCNRNDGFGSHYEQLQYYLPIKLIEAKTGRIISEVRFEGEPPPNCDGLADLGKNEYDGGRVQLVDVLSWLEGMVVDH